jgi:hypothetical protein
LIASSAFCPVARSFAAAERTRSDGSASPVATKWVISFVGAFA